MVLLSKRGWIAGYWKTLFKKCVGGGGRGEKIGKRLRKKDERERITGIFKLKGKLRLKENGI